MAEQSKISWTDSTFNPWIGCTKVSPGCDHCYAEQQDKFRGWTPAGWGAGNARRRTGEKLWAEPLKWDAQGFFECPDCGLRGTALDMGREPKGPCKHLSAKPARRRVFCASLADVFDNEVPREWRRDLFNLILSTPRLDWLLLTKRIGNAARMIEETLPDNMKALPADCPVAWPWPNVWIGATVVNQEEFDRDVPKLDATPAAIRFLSVEPMLGPIVDDGWLWGTGSRNGIDWVICGGESGPHARPTHPDWVRSLRDQCAAAGVPFHFKQWGEWQPIRGGAESLRVGKKAAGRLLNGVAHDGFPGAPNV